MSIKDFDCFGFPEKQNLSYVCLRNFKDLNNFSLILKTLSLQFVLWNVLDKCDTYLQYHLCLLSYKRKSSENFPFLVMTGSWIWRWSLWFLKIPCLRNATLRISHQATPSSGTAPSSPPCSTTLVRASQN